MSSVVQPQLICPTCKNQFELTPDYLAQYGGQETTCHCGTPLRIPYPAAQPAMAGAVPMAGVAQPVHPAMYGQPAQVIGYAGPAMMTGAYSMGVWREGTRLVVQQGCGLPDGCVLCGGPTNGRSLKKTYYWHHPALALLVLVAVLLYAIIALVVRKSIKLQVPICEMHDKRRRSSIMWAWITVLGGIALAIGLFAADQPGPGILLGFGCLITGIIIGAVGARVLTPKRIDDKAAWFSGASLAYLNQLPSR